MATLDDVVAQFSGLNLAIEAMATRLDFSLKVLQGYASSIYAEIVAARPATPGPSPTGPAPTGPLKVDPSPLPVIIAAAGGAAVGAAIGAAAAGSGVAPPVAPPSGPAGGAAEGGGGPLDSFFAGVSSITGVLDGVTAGMAGFLGVITSTAGAMTQFVGALAPGMLVQFNYAVKTLEAEFGSALAPAFQILTGVINQVSGAIDPLMQALAPILEEVANIVGSLLVPYVRFLAAELTAVLPIFKLVADVVSAIVPVFQAIATVVTAMVTVIGQFIASLFGDGKVKGAMDSFRHAMEEVAKFLILAVARIAALFGDAPGKGGLIDALTKGLEAAKNPAGPGVAPAPTNASSTTLESISKSIAEASYLAGGTTATPQNDSDRLDGILAELKNFKPESFDAIIQAAAKTAIKAVWDETVGISWASISSWFGSPKVETKPSGGGMR